MTHHTWAVITSFRPDANLHRAVSSIRSQVDGVVVIDDGSGSQFDDELSGVRGPGILVERLSANSGIAAALNRGLRIALSHGADAIVTLDQDSQVDDDFADRLIRSHAVAVDAGLAVGMVVPEYFAGVRQAYGPPVGDVLRARNVIQSGMLLTADLLHSVGGMFEPFFIDLVDVEFELRCASRGLLAIAAPGLRLRHQLGAQYRSRGRMPLPVMTLSTPFRYYYRARNRVLLNRRYIRSNFARLMRATVMDCIHFAIAWTMARPRRALWRLVAAGIRDGRHGRGGRISPELETLASTVAWNASRVDGPS